MMDRIPADDATATVMQYADESAVVARVYDTVANMNEPAPLAVIADLAMCDPAEAEPILNLLADLRVITIQTAEDPDRENVAAGDRLYARNEAFFSWWRAATLADEYTTDELADLQTRVEEQQEVFRDLYSVSSPDQISVSADNEALRDYISDDVRRWALLEETAEDIGMALTLCEVDPTRDSS